MARLEMTLKEVQSLLGGGRLVGSGDFLCIGVASLEAAGEADLSFVKDGRYFKAARASSAGALLVPTPIDNLGVHQLVVPDPFRALGMVLHSVAKAKRTPTAGVHSGAHVHESVEMGEDVSIEAGAVISQDSRIGARSVICGGAHVGRRSIVGEDCVIHPNAVVMEDVRLGDRVTIHGGAVIGADGYGYIQREGRHIKVPQVGEVVIGDDVEIGALATVDRATIDQTVIGRGTKIGDLSHVAHNCQIGEDVLILPMAGVSGSTKVGRGAVFAAGARCAENLTIGQGAVLGGATVNYEDVAPGVKLWGNPARELSVEKRVQALISRLPRMARDIKVMKKALDL